MKILNEISKARQKQQTNRVRAAMSAAYQLAKVAEGSAALSARFEGFGVIKNSKNWAFFISAGPSSQI